MSNSLSCPLPFERGEDEGEGIVIGFLGWRFTETPYN
jgi:hypothetical protein